MLRPSVAPSCSNAPAAVGANRPRGHETWCGFFGSSGWTCS